MSAVVVILNWNGWADTIECLESVFRSEYPALQVVVCDNGSTDGSLERIREWAEGKLDVMVPGEHPLRGFSFPPVPKPIAHVEYDRATAERGRGSQARGEPPLVLIRTGANLGYAGGNNVGMRYALARADVEHIWLLNNDTVVAPDALSRLVERLAAVPRAGMCGSTLRYYDAPAAVQTLGGFSYNRWLGTSRPLRPDGRRRLDARAIERRLFGIQGASVLVTRTFLERVGLLAEEYFLYFEEQDWAVRARRAGCALAFAAASVVYHKEGSATGGRSRATKAKSTLSDYHLIRSRLLFTRKFYPYALPSVYFGLLGTAVNRIRRRQWNRIPMLVSVSLRALRSGVTRA